MHDFTPISALLGGGLIGLAASVLLVGNGRIAGISGIFAGLFLPTRGDWLWRALFVLGLLGAGTAALWLAPERIGAAPRSLSTLIIAGLLVGSGTRLGSGCTSGHGVCGISRWSLRSIVATLTFMIAGMVTVRAFALLGVAP
jgi:uncharacterized membrane protein YedE/YeeE